MTSRRDILKGLVVGAAAAAVPTAASASTPADTDGVWSDGPAPWWLVKPLGSGTALGLGWYLYDLSAVRQGAAVLTLRHSGGREARVAISVHDGAPSGIAHTALLDLVLMDGHAGSGPTDEALGRVILGLARKVAANELSPDGDLWPIARMMTHRQRMATYGPESL